MLREAAIAEKMRRLKESQREQSRSPLEPNLFALWFPGLELGERLVFQGMDHTARIAVRTFQGWFKAAQRM
ncbi:hypothetical protein A3D71_00545 [Candidatus Kaiserbacteria bacterium RIFCSPHIGHO2_02_FULL_55_20]|uniref:Uncharacterized protein n=1 Tax=Candidatus Kaiserbacteria bacterium RIFCSPHIGHO2_02_FULL_55_20 TaxID=1798497 RepID=A0A1F6DYK4_9BACT|nr:MAG: hypothetical protein A2680_01560 [Candidatus Kaiserbacteria bacterium RIFCSPHIGHO2_01_FULL_55_37]OGG66524.1 MAG: hypothetical protein A3D71_00545 [Candidatus Kaiserbacteria bacterium RIFCSPHIGHO2_02_FULL_55_20]